MRRLSHLAFALALTLSPAAVAQTLVKDINVAPAIRLVAGSGPMEFTSDGGAWVYFSVNYRDSYFPGAGLYRTDGTVVEQIYVQTEEAKLTDFQFFGNRVLFAVRVGALDPELRSVDLATGASEQLGSVELVSRGAALGGQFYFIADRKDGHGAELWRTDGTSAGTSLVKDIRAGGPDGASGSVIALGSTLLFAGLDNGSGIELWTSDGTAAGTSLLKDIHPGWPSSSPMEFVELNGAVLFRADDGLRGVELWSTDGTAAGTVMLKDIRVGVTSSTPRVMVVDAGRLFFRANNASYRWDLWVTDGTSAGTVELAVLDAYHAPLTGSPVAPFGAGIVFRVSRSAGHELWTSDGTVAGTAPAFATGSTPVPTPDAIVPFGDKLGLVAQDATLWISDGTLSGTSELCRIEPPTSGSLSTVIAATPDGSGLVFAGAYYTFSAGPRPWFTDGTPAGTQVLWDLRSAFPGASYGSGIENMVDVYGRLFFSADDSAHGRELWVSDGTAAGTQLVKDIRSKPILETYLTDSDPQPLAVLGDKLLFLAHDGVTGEGLWATQGTEESTIKLSGATRMSANAATASGQARLGRRVFFASSRYGASVWVSDGTPAGTMELAHWPDELYMTSIAFRFAAVGDRVVFWHSPDWGPSSLWATDGTVGGTVEIQPFPSGRWMGVTIGSGKYLFAGSDTSFGMELWESDGTVSGTRMVKDIQIGAGGSSPDHLVAADDRLFFIADDGFLGAELWVSDGTDAGTRLLMDIQPGAAGCDADLLTMASDKLFFVADDGTHGSELWVSDGTSLGTQLVMDIGVTIDPEIWSLTAVGERVFFAARNSVVGKELWVSDGTAAGTHLVVDLQPGVGDGQVGGLMPVGTRRVAFNGTGGVWLSDGTSSGTRRIDSDWVSLHSNVELSGGRLFIAKEDPLAGSELHYYDLGATSKEIGHASGLTLPQLMASEAVIGGTWELSVDSEIPSSFGYVAMSGVVPPTSMFLPAYLAKDNQIYVDLWVASVMPLIPVGTDINGDWSLSVPVPGGMAPSPTLCVQGILINGSRWDLTNAVHFTIGH